MERAMHAMRPTDSRSLRLFIACHFISHHCTAPGGAIGSVCVVTVTVGLNDI